MEAKLRSPLPFFTRIRVVDGARPGIGNFLPLVGPEFTDEVGDVGTNCFGEFSC